MKFTIALLTIIIRVLYAYNDTHQQHVFGNLIMIKYQNPSTSYETHVRVCKFYGKRVPQLKDLPLFFDAVAKFGIHNRWLVKHQVMIAAPFDYLYIQFKTKFIGSHNAMVVYLSKEYIGSSLFLCVRKWITNDTAVPTLLPLGPPPTTPMELTMIALISLSLLILCILLFTNVLQTRLLRSTRLIAPTSTASMVAV